MTDMKHTTFTQYLSLTGRSLAARLFHGTGLVFAGMIALAAGPTMAESDTAIAAPLSESVAMIGLVMVVVGAGIFSHGLMSIPYVIWKRKTKK